MVKTHTKLDVGSSFIGHCHQMLSRYNKTWLIPNARDKKKSFFFNYKNLW
jgi:hypothetical protein